MAILPILKYPAPILRQRASEVTQFDRSLVELVANMTETLYAYPGAVGIAAPQIGESLRVVVMDLAAATTRDKLCVLVNPVILSQSRQKLVREGCLSFPDYLANVRRSLRVHLKFQDTFGEARECHAEGLEAVCFQHEIDHLDGVLMIDRVTSLVSDWIRRQPR